ncbi:MAG TPA: hypothetical protein VFG69_07875 [Nannocystaceae bacterium]|nr:hypothetical protein [Nannocystaceae bacterium]
MTLVLVGAGDARDHALFTRLREAGAAVVLANLGTNGLLADDPDVVAVESIASARALLERIEPTAVVVQRPELLFAGAVDALSRPGVPVFGPRRFGAVLELSKLRAKAFMQRHGVATPAYRRFATATEAIEFLRREWSDDRRWVIKSDRYLAAAHLRTAVPRTLAEAERAVVALAAIPIATRGSWILIESCLAGVESSVHLVIDGTHASLCPPVRDYKRLYDRDRGPNTHGMGAVAGGRLDARAEALLRARIIEPTLAGLAHDQLGYRGVLYIGVMWTADGPVALEYNVRPGNPEWVALLTLVDGPSLARALAGDLVDDLQWQSDRIGGAAFATVPGYPIVERSHAALVGGIERAREIATVLGEGVVRDAHGRLHAGRNRSLCVSAEGATVADMRARLYPALAALSFLGRHYRSDIGEGFAPGRASTLEPLVRNAS